MNESAIESLSEENQCRVAEILESCLVALENGSRFEPATLIAANPDLAEPLQKCLTSLVTLHEAVHGPDDTIPCHPLLSVGGRLGDFVIEGLIGRGGMGVVYSALQMSLHRRVALKLLPNSHLLPPSQLQRFQLEAKAIASLRHANIVPVYSVGHEAGLHYFAMQLIEGQSLDKLDHPRWSTSRYQTFFKAAIELADALRHAHASGVIHRDIKPSNLILDNQGKVWITDFGLARCKSETRLTVTGDLLGTVNYMSPEQACGRPVDERTDIYSLGITLYEMLCGKQAFPGEQAGAILRQIENLNPHTLRRIKPDIPYDLETVILKAISKDREDRYHSAGEMLEDLQAVRDGRPIAGRRPGLVRVVSRWAARHMALVGVAGIGLVATLLAVSLGTARVLLAQRDLKSAQVQSQIHRETAEANYWQGRNLVEHWHRDIIRRLADLPGAEDLHAQMLSDTIAYYESFLERAADDSHLAADIVRARLGLAAAVDQSGDSQRAVSLFEKAIASLERLARSDVDCIRPLALARNDLAVVLLRLQRVGPAAELLQQAWQQVKQLPLPAQEEEYLAAILVNLARAHQLQSRPRDEQAALDQAEELYRKLIIQSPNNGDLLSELATVLDHRALLMASHDAQAALRISGDAIAMHRRSHATKSQPEELPSAKWRQRLAASLHNHAVLAMQGGDPVCAERSFRESIEIKSALVKLHPQRPERWRELAGSYEGMANFEADRMGWSKLRQLLDELDQLDRATGGHEELMHVRQRISMLEQKLTSADQGLQGEKAEL